LIITATVLAVVATTPATAVAAPVDDGSRPGDPTLSIDPAAVQAAMTCRGPADGGNREPVLLVHGTSMTGLQAFGWNYLPELAARGYRVCTVDLPDRSLADIQVSAEYVVVAVHRLARESGRKVDILAHSQGALEARWAVRWWPSVQADVDDVVSLAGPNQGTTAALGGLMPATGCPACTQMTPGSAFLTALNSGNQTPGPVSSTSIYSTLVDQLITPNASAARIESAANIELQAVCPARVVTHGSIIVDAAAFALVTDAFSNSGPAAASRFNRATCSNTTFVALPPTLSLGILLQPITMPATAPIPTAEPPLKPYTRPAAAPSKTATTPVTRTVTPTAAGTTARPITVTFPNTPPAGSAPAPTASSRPASATPTQPEPPAGLSVQPAKATRSTGRSVPGPFAGLILVLLAGAAGTGTIHRRRRNARCGPAVQATSEGAVVGPPNAGPLPGVINAVS